MNEEVPYVILGAGGFVGSSLARHLSQLGRAHYAIGRSDSIPERPGHVIYCIGLTADFRQKPFETIEAHVSKLAQVLSQLRFESFTYLSSTRVYQRLDPDGVAVETSPLPVEPSDPSDIYNLSKLTGESICLAQSNPAIRVVRLSNVYGGVDRSENFLTIILRQVLTRGQATFFNSLSSEKDYVAIADVVRALELIPLRAKGRIINLASGRNVTNSELAALILKHTGRSIDVLAEAPELRFPRISIERLVSETGVQPGDLADNFASLVAECRTQLGLRLAP